MSLTPLEKELITELQKNRQLQEVNLRSLQKQLSDLQKALEQDSGSDAETVRKLTEALTASESRALEQEKFIKNCLQKIETMEKTVNHLNLMYGLLKADYEETSSQLRSLLALARS